jgi:hypothetical protein
MEEDQARKVSRKITSYLFHNGAGELAKRLVLELPNGRNGGGWSEKPAENVIFDILLKEL